VVLYREELGVAAFVIIGRVQLWILTARLVTIVDPEALRISFKWLWPGRTIRHGDVERYEARTYGLLDSGGWESISPVPD
jgi:hypothetical protein